MKLNTTEVHAAHEWMAKHPKELEKHINEWVAVTAQGIIGSARSLLVLAKKPQVKKAHKQGKVLFAPIPNPKLNYVL